MELVDSHAHLDFYDSPGQIVANARAAGVSQILAIGIGDGPATMHRAAEIAAAHQGVWASVGIHPQEAAAADADALARLEEIARRPRVIAVGEIGLDYYHAQNPGIAMQQAAFRAQMEIAARVGKPIILHCRTSELAAPAAKARFGAADAAEDLLTMLEQEWAPAGLPGILHCFSGTQTHAERALAIGFYLSFAGNLTYPKSIAIQQVAAWAPADRILVETDSPFLAPVPLRGQRNEPANVVHTAAFLAGLRGVSAEELARTATQNFRRLFPGTSAG
jgi:TatD DNase family protein